MHFLNDWTEKHIEFSRIHAMIVPDSEYGRRYHRERKPFVKGHEDAWARDRHDVDEFVSALRQAPAAMQSWQSDLSHVPLVDDAVARLSRGDVVQAEHLTALQRFGHYVQRIDRTLKAQCICMPWWDADVCNAVVERLAAPGQAAASPVFRLADVAGERYRDALARLQGISTQRAALERETVKQIAQDLGVVARRDGSFTIPVDATDQIERARGDARLQFRMQTAFESIWEAVYPEQALWLSQIEEAEDALREAERNEYLRIACDLKPWAADLRAVCASVGRLDEILARIRMGDRAGWNWTTLGDDLRIDEGVLPDRTTWTPVSMHLHTPVTVLSGPNMGGKTSAMVTLLVAVACHHYGYPVSAQRVVAPLFTALRYVGGDAQSNVSGLSSFGAEVVMLTEAVAFTDALLCLDEIGRHTNPREGHALVMAVCDVLRTRSTACGRSLLSTHFALTLEGVSHLRIRGLQRDLLDRPTPDALSDRLRALQVAMDYTVIADDITVPPAEGLRVAQWMGLPPEILTRAWAHLETSEQQSVRG